MAPRSPSTAIVGPYALSPSNAQDDRPGRSGAISADRIHPTPRDRPAYGGFAGVGTTDSYDVARLRPGLFEKRHEVRGGNRRLFYRISSGCGYAGRRKRATRSVRSAPGQGPPTRPSSTTGPAGRVLHVGPAIRASSGRSDALVPLGGRPPGGLGVTCFFVDRHRRGQGVTQVPLEGAVVTTRRSGRGTVEAYPVELEADRVATSFLWTGTVAMFVRRGFSRIARMGRHKSIVQRSVSAVEARTVRPWPSFGRGERVEESPPGIYRSPRG